MSRFNSLRDSVRDMQTAIGSLDQTVESENRVKVTVQYRFWRIVVPGVNGKVEEFFAANLADAFKFARIRWPLAVSFKCVGSRE